jgi:hypothetical protein
MLLADLNLNQGGNEAKTIYPQVYNTIPLYAVHLIKLSELDPQKQHCTQICCAQDIMVVTFTQLDSSEHPESLEIAPSRARKMTTFKLDVER